MKTTKLLSLIIFLLSLLFTSLSLSEAVAQGPPFNFIFQKTTIPTGEIGCMDVVVENFTDIRSFEFGFTFDQSLFSMVGIESVHLDPNELVIVNQVNIQDITISMPIFFDFNGSTTIKDNEVAFSICFEAIGEKGSRTEIEFTDLANGNPSQIFTLNGSFQIPDLNFTTADLIIGTEDCPPSSFKVGDKWTYDDHVYLDIFFQDFEIVDEVEWMGKQAMVIRPGLLDSEDYMVQEDGKVYFWDDNIEEYQLNYDFNNDSVYYIRYFNIIIEDIDSTAVYIDSIRNVEFNGQDREVQYCRSDFGYGGIEYTREIISNIGNSTFGPRMPITVIIDNFSGGIGDIRCFESSDYSIQFVDFPCDTTFITTSTIDLLESKVNIYPNPVQDKLYLETTEQNWNYQILNLQGQQMMSGVYQNDINVEQLPSGIYFLQLQLGDELYQAIKFVKE